MASDFVASVEKREMIDTKSIRTLAERYRYQDEKLNWPYDMLLRCADEIDALRGQALSSVEREEYMQMQEDAKRYRWLRECQSIPANILLNHHEQLDEAIDRARNEGSHYMGKRARKGTT